MLKAEVKYPSGIRLTESDTDGIFLHFRVGDKKGGIRLDCLLDFMKNEPSSSLIKTWAESQLCKAKNNQQNCEFLHKSDCGTHNHPAIPIENCDCDVVYELLDEFQLRLSTGYNRFHSDCQLISEAKKCLSGDIRRGKNAIQDAKKSFGSE